MGGLGKTTLAKAVYNKSQIHKHFDKKLWVCVAEKVDRIEEVFKMFLESLIGGKVEGDRREVIVQKIQDELKEKRYFLVLDDLWNDQEVLLNDFFSTLAGLNAKKGSWCLVTTRLQEVATILSRHPQINSTCHELGRLCNNDCWSIVKNWANVGEQVPRGLEDIREQVLGRCDGLPLAAKLIGGLLYNKKRKEEWLSILKESLLNGDQGGTEQIIKVSFDHLSPAPVKKCFAYCSIFYQDTELEQDLLVELWMAEGFLQPDSQNERMMEGIGYEYLRTLLQTSLLEEVKEERRTWYKMHDLVHDFAKSILNRNSNNQDRRQEEGRGIQELGTLQDLKGSLEIRNLELVNGKDDAELANLSKKLNLHRLVFEWGYRDRESNKCNENVLEGLQPHPNLKELHIRYFRGDQFPQWFMNLTSLVELRVVNCRRCRELPALGQLPSLQHLYLTGLENIRSIGLSFYSTISRQTFFPALKFLSLERLKNLKEWKDAHEMRSTAGEVHVMDVFPMLETLSISDCPRLTTIPTPSRFPSLDVLEIKKDYHALLAEKVLSNIATLSSLELRGGFRQRTDVELRFAKNITTLRGMSCAACLERLIVIGCDNLREIQYCRRIDSFGYPNPKNSFGQKGLLKSLEEFSVEWCRELTRLPVEMFESCTSLRELKLSNCRSLVSFPLDLRRTPSLESFSLFKCPNLIAEMPSGFGYLTSLRKVEIGPFSDYSVIEFDWAGLASSSSLRHVSLHGMPDTKSLSHQLQDLTTITSLSLRDFGAIEALPDWLGNLASLDELFLFNCQKLEYLPSMAAMERIKLRRLAIRSCPLLKRRCTLESGSEWPKISNIQERDIRHKCQ
ncbi:unnamed protein product [Coffea canephora]|uniref:Uncharacterized protein n=1 Tax=Coffea canephora TaxID=49390 RepID=A0A068V8B6_COFCA|nr:unnamed protein product [Coffea canephora]